PDTGTPEKPVNEVAESPKVDISEEKTPEPETEIMVKEDLEVKNEEPASETVYTLESTSEDIDRFLSSLPQLKAALKDAPKDTSSVDLKNDDDSSKDDGKETDADKDAIAKVSGLEIPDFVEKFVDLVEEKVSKQDSGEGKAKFGQLSEDTAILLEAVDRITKLNVSLYELRSDPIHGLLINYIGAVQQRAMAYLEVEFRTILEETRTKESDRVTDAKGKQEAKPEADRCTLLPESESTDEDDSFPGYPEEVVSNLNNIAKKMISGGCEFECCEIYMSVRRNAFDESLNKLGFEKLSMDEVQKMQWDAIEREIAIWIKTFKQCATVYFSGEKNFVEAVFADYPSISESLFSNLIRGVVIQLLNIAEAVAISKRSAEKLFKFLDLYETLRDNAPAIYGLFPDECANEIKTEIITVRCRLGEAAISIFCDLENSIKSDQGKTPVPGGAVHPLTRYTMNYLKYACEYKDTLEQVFREHSKIERPDSTSRSDFEDVNQSNNNNNSNNDPDQSPFSNQLMRVMDLLDANLEAKSKLYKDISLSCIFMMNNGRYILQKIKSSSEIHQTMGDQWCRKRSSDLRNYHKGYQRETWTKLLGCLSHEGLMDRGKVVKPVLKEKFKSFNAMFDEIHKTQSTWVVSDEQLQSELRVSISAVVIPAYRSFLGRFSQYLDAGRQTEKYIKLQAEDIETYIDELFDGNPSSSMVRR
ncbi:Exo70 domain-containing protein, partial [Cephalotus follicularis]